MDILIRVAQFILGLSILVVLHEWGHFVTARMFKTRVEKFYLFFDFLFPLPNVLNFALFKKKIGETEYGIGWFPLGGYVKISGMIDESMDEEFLNSEPQPWEFRAKPAWQRLIIMLGGIIVNVLLAVLIYSMIALYWGSETLPMANAKYGFAADSLAQSIGFQNGDKLIGYDGKHKFETADISVLKDLILNDAKSVQIERNGQQLTINIPDDVFPTIVNSRGEIDFLRIAFPSDIDTILPASPVFGKMLKGDHVISLAGEPIQYFNEIRMVLRRHKNQEIPIEVLRGADTVRFTAKVPEDGLLQLGAMDPEKYFTYEKKTYNLLTCFPAGIKLSIETLRDYIKQFKIIFSSRYKGWKQLGGFASISKMYGTKWNWQLFWYSTAFLSLVLAFMNLLPIPALDGGHALFTVYEMVTRRKPSDKFLEYAQVAGMIFVLGLLVYANGNDLVRFLMEKFAK